MAFFYAPIPGLFYCPNKGVVMASPKCPLCGATSTRVGFAVGDQNELIHLGFADDCHFCKQEEEIHWRQWWQGPDITEAGGSVPIGTFKHPDVLDHGRVFPSFWDDTS